MFAKPGAPQREEMSAIRVKNTTLHLNGQNVRLAAKIGRNSKTPGLHPSAAQGKEAAGQLTACSLTQEGTAAQLDPSPGPELEREAENPSPRRPQKLAPLGLPEEVREAQRQKLKFVHQDVKPASCKLDAMARKAKPRARQRLEKAAACPSSASAEPLRAQQQNTASTPRLTRSVPVELSGDKLLEGMVCRGTPAPLRGNPAPPSHRVKTQAAHGMEAARQNPAKTPQQEAGSMRPRLRRAQCLEEDQSNSNTSTGGLSADKGKLAQGVQGRGQRAERAARVQMHAGKGIKEAAAVSRERRGVGKSRQQEDCGQQSARCTLDRQPAQDGSGEQALDGVKPSASNWRLKRKIPLITKHDNAVPLERLQL